jgi:hypothetical protein
MPRIAIEISDDDAASLAELAEQCTAAHQERDGATTHGKLDVPALLAMLAQDAAMVIARPGSWEGSKMADLLSSHGYEF